ncbi:MAG: alanine--tRNA ligase [Minisyncoccia bacterium]
MTVNEVRSRYLAFFEKREHAIIPSAPIVPENDPTTLFTSSGMQPLVPYLLGAPHPKGTRLADSQISFRAGDIEEVGDNRHTTFFEMLGNWSLGDYFKKEQLPWIFEFLTSKEEGLGFDPVKLYVTVFDGDVEAGMDLDTEAVEIWKELFAQKGMDAALVRIGTEEEGYEKGMQGGRIFSYGSKKNWWSRAGVPKNMPPGEPGGPDSEIFYDFETPHDLKWGKECHVNCDCGRFVEISNSVFMQFVKNADGSFSELPNKNVDFGGGLERLAAATLDSSDVFTIDVFAAPRVILETRSGKTYGENEQITRSFRIILDHIRAATFMLASGIRPQNSEQGYVLRRLVRRAIREADRLAITDAILPEIAAAYGESYAGAYPFIRESAENIRTELSQEEERFRKTLTQGLREFEKFAATNEISADAAFTLFTTYGFPIEMTEELAKERNISIDQASVETRLKEHQAQSRAGAEQKFTGGLADHAEQTVRYHTAHHILLKALQMVLGPEVHQRGSNITSERLRIDFSYGQKMTPEQIAAVEKIVNEKIIEELPVSRTVMPKEEAEKFGAEHEFGVKYPDMVSVYSVGPKNATPENPNIDQAFSIEFCGGPHVSNTRELGEGGKKFKILKEEASSAGVRRIKAVLVVS